MYIDDLHLGYPEGFNAPQKQYSEAQVSNSELEVLSNPKVYATSNFALLLRSDKGQITITTYPHNCGLLIVSGANAESEDHYKKLFKMVQTNAVTMGYSQLHYTAVQDNEEENSREIISALEKSGYKALIGSEVVNDRSGNTVVTYVCNLV